VQGLLDKEVCNQRLSAVGNKS